ncbi:MAG TPA: hypothetical protein VH988_19570, partial [Thermoanaerobaculia bacterium]|nr:hypothetical protein [Thermoanaerobaculia bacterium]
MNPRLRFSLVLAACLLASATPLLSAEAPLEKITLTVNVVAGGKPPTVSPPPGPIVVKGTTVPLEIRCDGVDCNKVSVKFSDQQITLTVAQDTKSAAAQLALKSAAGGSLSLAFDSQPIFEAQVTQGGDAKKPVVISKLCQDDSGKDVKWIGLLCILFWLGMVIVRWHRIARPSRELLRAQITSLRAEMATTPVANHNKADLAEIAKLLDAASALIGRSKWFSGFGVIDFLFWSRGQEIAGWGYVHDVERQITPFLSEATVRVRLEAVEQRLRLTTDAPCLALADAIHKALGEQPADGLRLRALLDQGLSTVYGREDNSYASLVSWQNKTSWLVGCGLVLILVLAAVTQHHAIL